MMRDLGLEKPAGTLFKQLPIVALDAEVWTDYFSLVARKIVLSQHYRCFKTPLSANGRVYARLIPNAHIGNGDWFSELTRDLPQVEIGQYGNEDLGDQYACKWHASEDGNLGMFVTHIQSMIYIIGLTGESREWVSHIDHRGGVAPFD